MPPEGDNPLGGLLESIFDIPGDVLGGILGTGGESEDPFSLDAPPGSIRYTDVPGLIYVLVPPEGPGFSPQWEPIQLSKTQMEMMGLLQDEMSSSSADAAAANATANRRITLEGAIGALRGYNDAQVAADQRRANAMSEARSLAGILVPKGTEFFPGLGPQGPLARATEAAGLPFEPARVVEKEFQPQALAEAPGVSPEIQQMLTGIRSI